MTEQEKFLNSITLVCDSREKNPFRFKNKTVVGTLKTGDYSILGFENTIAIERKETNDLISSICQNRERFEAELMRGRALDYFAIVAECSLSTIANGDFKSSMNPKSAIQSLLTFSIRYRLPIFFAENATYGARITESLLLKFCRERWKEFSAHGAKRVN